MGLALAWAPHYHYRVPADRPQRLSPERGAEVAMWAGFSAGHCGREVRLEQRETEAANAPCSLPWPLWAGPSQRVDLP